MSRRKRYVSSRVRKLSSWAKKQSEKLEMEENKYAKIYLNKRVTTPGKQCCESIPRAEAYKNIHVGVKPDITRVKLVKFLGTCPSTDSFGDDVAKTFARIAKITNNREGDNLMNAVALARHMEACNERIEYYPLLRSDKRLQYTEQGVSEGDQCMFVYTDRNITP